jgi:hypothetical protein
LIVFSEIFEGFFGISDAPFAAEETSGVPSKNFENGKSV